MEKDVVCGMQVDETATAHRFDHTGKTFYFCSEACRAKFSKSPETYANKDARIREHLSAVYRPPRRDSDEG
jgi:Cu+-exporting ATPase